MLRRTAIYFAKEAYKLWLYNGIRKAGFVSVPQDDVLRSSGVSYIYTTDDWFILLKQNGALYLAQKREV